MRHRKREREGRRAACFLGDWFVTSMARGVTRSPPRPGFAPQKVPIAQLAHNEMIARENQCLGKIVSGCASDDDDDDDDPPRCRRTRGRLGEQGKREGKGAINVDKKPRSKNRAGVSARVIIRHSATKKDTLSLCLKRFWIELIVIVFPPLVVSVSVVAASL